MKFYDFLAGFPNHSYILFPTEALKIFPQLKADNLKYVAVFYEGQQNDTRTGITIALTAAKYGALIANYIEAIALVKDPCTQKYIILIYL